MPHPRFHLRVRLYGACEVCCGRFERPVAGQRCCSIACANKIRFGAPKPLKRRVWVAGPCASCGAPFVSSAGHARYCSTVCEKRVSRQVRKDLRRARLKAQRVERVYRRKVYERDNWTCRLCLKPVDRDAVVPADLAATLDHILPLALGGSHEYSNVQTAHFICNSRKGANVVQLSFAA